MRYEYRQYLFRAEHSAKSLAGVSAKKRAGARTAESRCRRSCKCEVMNDDTTRAVSLTRLSRGRYEAVNARGGTIEFSTDREQTFTPVELFLASIAGCSAIDVDFITSHLHERRHTDRPF